VDRFQVAQAGDLAGGVALQSDGQLFAQQPRPVVFQRNQAHPASAQAQRDLGGAGVQRVVSQLAHDRRRALDHFARSDLADEFVRQFANRAAGGGGEQGVHRCILRCIQLSHKIDDDDKTLTMFMSDYPHRRATFRHQFFDNGKTESATS